MKKKLFLVAVLLHPNEQEIAEGVQTELLLEPTPILAKDEQSAKLLAVRLVGDDVDLDNAEILVRPF